MAEPIQQESAGVRPSYVYVASSWRCMFQPAIVAALRSVSIPHYDFRNPEGGTGFSWREVMPSFDIDRQEADADEYIVGQGKRTAVLLDGPIVTPELMYKMVDYVAPCLFDLLGWLGVED